MRVPIAAEFTINRKGQIIDHVFHYVNVGLTNKGFENLCQASRFDLKADELRQIEAANAAIEKPTTDLANQKMGLLRKCETSYTTKSGEEI